MNTGVTTIRNYSRPVRDEARERASALALPYVPREGTLEDMAAMNHMDGFLIYGKKQPSFWTGGEEYRFHLGTAVLRTAQMERGNSDRLCRLLPPERPLSVLDATFGQGGDSTVMSWFLGEEGKVTSLEKSTVLYEIGRVGLSSFDGGNERMTRALRRIHLLHEDFRTFLQRAAPKSFDVIYFDTMFRAPVKRDVNRMEGFRRAASYDLLDEEILTLALHIARKRIIVKERPFSPLFQNSLFSSIHSHQGQSTAYGVIDI